MALWFGLSLDVGAGEAGVWYGSYANMDVIEGIEWQLAEPGAALGDNPFVPRLRLYAAGFYPFSYGPREMVLFTFLPS